MTPVTEYIASTTYDVPIRTFETRREALLWWAERAVEFPGASLDEVTTQTIVTRRTVRKARVAA
jgi:hypothetical protein